MKFYELFVKRLSEADKDAFWNDYVRFGELFEIVQADGTRAHTACVGFGLERITLALLRAHGTGVASNRRRSSAEGRAPPCHDQRGRVISEAAALTRLW